MSETTSNFSSSHQASPSNVGIENNNKRPAPRGTAAYPRKRAVTACQVCRARRTKCDNLKPSCSFCLKVGAVCVQSAVDLSSFDPASLKILERLDDLEGLLRSSAGANSASPVPSSNTNIVPVHQNAHLVTLDRSYLLPSRLEALLQAEDRFSQEKSILATLRQPTPQTTASPSTSSPISATVDLETQTTRSLLDSFFNYVHVKNPILQEAPTRRMVSQICLHGVDWSAQSCLTLVICALGAIATPFGPSDSTSHGSTAYAHGQSYFQAAQKRLGLLMASGGLLEAQCLFLAGIYMMCVFQPSAAWRFFCQSLACCQEFDLLTSPASQCETTKTPQLQAHSALVSIAEQAIYWSSWKSHEEVRSELQPHDFRRRHAEEALYPPFFPTPPCAVDHQDDDVDQAQIERQAIGWYFYLSEISLRRLASRIANVITNTPLQPGKDVTAMLLDKLPDHEAEVTRWVRTLPELLSLDTNAACDDVCKFVLRGHLIDLWEMLYCPFLDACLNRRVGTATQKYQEVRRIAELALLKHVERVKVNMPGFYHRHHGTWAMVRTCTRSAIMLMKAARYELIAGKEVDHDRIQLRMPLDWKDAVCAVLDLNRHWQGEVPDARERMPKLQEMWSMVEYA